MDPNKDALQNLEKELKPYKKMLAQAAEIIIEQAVSDYPILVVHQQDLASIGIPIIEKEKVSGNWSVNASTLEEFITRQIIREEKAESFKSLYQQHRAHICLFVLTEGTANFAFIPKA